MLGRPFAFLRGKMSTTGLWPREKPRPTDSHAELNVYDALRRQLPGSWTARESLCPFTTFPDLPSADATPQHNRHDPIHGMQNHPRPGEPLAARYNKAYPADCSCGGI